MKRSGVFLILIPSLIAATVGIYYILNPYFDKGNLNHNSAQKEMRTDAGDVSDESNNIYVESDGNISDSKSAVTHSALSGYLMRAEQENINIYEVYDNGHKEKIKTLDINPKYMRKNDYNMLTDGISVKSYDEICSLIEDFSS